MKQVGEKSCVMLPMDYLSMSSSTVMMTDSRRAVMPPEVLFQGIDLEVWAPPKNSSESGVEKEQRTWSLRTTHAIIV